MPLKQVDGSGVVEQGADQIGAGLGAEAQQLGVMDIGFQLQEINRAGQPIAAVEGVHDAVGWVAVALGNRRNERLSSRAAASR